jgi:cell division protein ZapA (FtsZ GTPase activity inhibitor)
LTRRVKVGILGEEYVLHTQGDDAHVEDVSRYLNSRCEEARRATGPSSPAAILALAALNIASDYLRMKESHERLLQRIERQQEKLSTFMG